MMDEIIKRRWIAALRSGNYKQGKGALRRFKERGASNQESSFCCLGVLCEVIGAEHDDGVGYSPAREELTTVYLFPDGERNSATLPLDFRESLGINKENTRNLIHMNDNQEKTFDEIADYIEEKL